MHHMNVIWIPMIVFIWAVAIVLVKNSDNDDDYLD